MDLKPNVFYADTREPSSRLGKEQIRSLVHRQVQKDLPDVSWHEYPMEAGDYGWLTNEGWVCLISRKTVSDLINSLKSKTLIGDLTRCLECAKITILLIEDFMTVTQTNQIKTRYGIQSYRWPWLANALLEFQLAGVYIERTANPLHTARRLAELYTWFQKEDHTLLRSSLLSSTSTKLPPAVRFLASLPGFSSDTSKRVLSHFGTIRDFIAATPKERQKVGGIGSKRAKIIDSVLDANLDTED